MPEPLTPSAAALCAAIVLFAYFVRGILGFGSGLIAIPLLALILPLPVVVPAVALTDLLASLSQGIGSRRAILWPAVWPLLPFMLAGILAALWLFERADPGILSRGLGVFVVCYALYTLSGLHPGRVPRPRWGAPLGAAGSTVSTLFGIGGPFYVAYLQLWGPAKTQFRATAATLFLVEGSTRIAGYLLSGLLLGTPLTLFALALPLTVLGLYVGHRVHARIAESTFRRLVGAVLIASGLALVLK